MCLQGRRNVFQAINFSNVASVGSGEQHQESCCIVSLLHKHLEIGFSLLGRYSHFMEKGQKFVFVNIFQIVPNTFSGFIGEPKFR